MITKNVYYVLKWLIMKKVNYKKLKQKTKEGGIYEETKFIKIK